MFLSNILTETKALIDSVAILKEYQVQITPDEKPFPSSGDKTITIHGSEVFRKSQKMAAEYVLTTHISINRKMGNLPNDRQRLACYLEEVTALSSVGSILTLLIDNSIILYSNIVSSIENSKTSIVNQISLSTPPSPASTSLSDLVANLTVLQPILVSGFSGTPIPRFDEFFHAFNTKRGVEIPFGNDRIQESGWSMKLAFQGPNMVLKTPC
jgi:hypothetical protein